MNLTKANLILLLCCPSLPLLALPEDSKAPLQIHANSADINETTHLGKYIGQIELDQGTTHIRAATAVTKTNTNHQLIEAIIEGDLSAPAHYWSLMSKDKPILHAYADKIIYYPLKQDIKLIGHAHIAQGQHQFTAPVILYNLTTQHVLSLPQADEQTMITIYPEPTS